MTILIVILSIAILAAIGFAAYHLYNKFYNKRPVSMEHDYVWLGEGDHPYKHNKKIKLKF
jgi:hypothetical protein